MGEENNGGTEINIEEADEVNVETPAADNESTTPEGGTEPGEHETQSDQAPDDKGSEDPE